MFRTLLALGFFLLTACNPIRGQLNVTKAFNAQSDDRPANCSPEDSRPDCYGPITPIRFQVPPGRFDASFEFASRDSAVFSVKMGSRETRKINLNVPKNNHLPNYSGPISLTASESGQPFDLRGAVDTKESDSERRNEWQHCTRTEWQQHCDPQGCHAVPVDVPGNQWVVYHYHYTDTSLDLGIFAPGRSEESARFSGRRNLAEKVMEQTGVCL